MTGRLTNIRPKPGFMLDAAGQVVPTPNVVGFFDSLTNVMSGLGTSAAKGPYAGYNFLQTTPQQVEGAYRSSWLMRKVVDLPALDMTRAWRGWKAPQEQIKLLEKEERRLQLKHKVKRALVLARLWGGSVMLLGAQDGTEDLEQPLNLDKVGKGDLGYLPIFARHEVDHGQKIEDPRDPWHGHPEYWRLKLRNGADMTLHPSRVISFVGQPAPEGSMLQQDWLWGDPIYQSIESALKNADLAQDGFAELIHEAKVDVIKIPDLMKKVGSSEYESKLLARLAAAATGKSSHRALVIDGSEEWDQKEVTWAGIPDIIITFLQMVAGAADIPVTRLLGQSPKGLQSTGDGERQDYHDMIAARQEELLQPALDRVDELLIRSALGTRPDEIWWQFEPLDQMDEKEAAEVEERRAKTVQIYGVSGLVDPQALSTIAKNAMIEGGRWPGAEEAFAEAEEMSEEGDEPDPNDPDDLAEVQTPEERQLADEKRKRRWVTDVAFNDGKVRTLYVSRKVLNAADILAHYADQGIDGLEDAAELHVTIAYSTTPIDWMKISTDWSGGDDGTYTVPPGGPRQTDLFGPSDDVLVLAFNDLHLEWRHEHMLDKGASWKWLDYRPHITIALDKANLDSDAIKPWTGPIRLGPEIFEEVKRDA